VLLLWKREKTKKGLVMIKRYCDKCDKKIDGADNRNDIHPVAGKNNTISITISKGQEDYCSLCLKIIVMEAICNWNW